jgi:hypothetical protein
MHEHLHPCGLSAAITMSFFPHAYSNRKIAENIVMKFDTSVFTEEPSGDLDFLFEWDSCNG